MRGGSIKLAVLILLAAIAAPAADGTRVYVYCPRKAQYGASLRLSVNNINVAKLAWGKFVVLSLSPGNHMLQAGKSEPAKITVEPGTTRYFRVAWARKWFLYFQMPGQQSITEVPADAAESELRTGISYLSQKNIRDISVVLPPSADLLRK